MNDGKATVVIVDDDSDDAAFLAFVAESNGYDVRIASDGVEAIAVIEAHKPHCVLLDIGMSRMDGAELAPLLRHRFGHELVLVAITGRGNDDSRVAPTFALVDHYLKKPIDPDALGTSVAIALGSHLLPPPSNGLGGESRGVVIDAHTHPALVLTEVIHAVRDGFAEIGFKKVMDLDLLGLTLGLPLGFCRNSGMRPNEAVWSADDQKASE